jgi:hypothetical protein
LLARAIPETAAVIIGSLGRERRRISCRLGHRVGKVVIIEAVIALGRLDTNPMLMTVVLGERNKGRDWMNSPVTGHKRRVFRFGNKGSWMAQSCREKLRKQGV